MVRDVCMDFEPYFKVHNLVSVHPKSIILGQMTNLNMIFHVEVSVYRLVKLWNSPQFPDELQNGQLLSPLLKITQTICFHYIFRLFQIAPELKDLFPFGDDFTKPQFTTHALNVMNAVDLTVQNLDNPDVLIPKLKELGQFHAVFELTVKEFQVRLLL